MRKVLGAVLGLALAIGASGCRQADGTVPAPTEDQRNEIGDIGRDMINIANNDPDGPADLQSDLAKYAPDRESSEPIVALGRRLAEALRTARVEEETAQKLAYTLWVGVSAREISERQVESLQNDLRMALSEAGVSEAEAQALAAQLGDVQRHITERPKRWYHVF